MVLTAPRGKMRSHNYSSLPDVANFISKSCLCVEFKDSPVENLMDNEKLDESLYDLDGFEEVFADHILMNERLRKTLYAGDFECIEDLPDYPPTALTGLALEIFSKAVPNYGLDILDMDYASSVTEAARVSPCAMIIAMIYLERLQMKNSEYLDTVSPPGLFVVTMLVASKFLFEDDEDIVTNRIWSEALNFDIKELNTLEKNFLAEIDWKVYIDSTEYFNYLCKIEKKIAVKQSSLRNWFSYTEILVLMRDPNFQKFLTSAFTHALKTVVVCTLGYVAAALALYSAGITLHKLKTEPSYVNTVVKNDTSSLENFHSPRNMYFAINPLISNNGLSDEDFQTALTTGDLEKGSLVLSSCRNPSACKSLRFNIKHTIQIKVTKPLSSKILNTSTYNITSSNEKLKLEYISNNLPWYKFRRNGCASVLIR